MKRYLATFTVLMLMASSALCQESGYKLLHTQAGKVFHLGPTGIWGYGPGALRENRGEGENPDFFIVERVEVGSPAHGRVHKYDVITGVNGKTFSKDRDPRIDFAFGIEDSEAKDGELSLHITRGGTPVKVTVVLGKLPVYSPTWPFNCERTDMMLSNAAEYLKREQMPEGDVVADDGNIGPVQAGLFWLAMGEPRYLQNAVRAAYWYKEMCEKNQGGWCWTQGYGGLLLAEYYNMTGDKNILPGLELVAKQIARGQMPSGGWSHGGYSGFGAGYGEVNCAGMVCYMALLEAREIGVNVDHKALAKAERYFEKFAATLSNQYGDHNVQFEKLGYRGLNGKVGGISVAHRLNDKLDYSAQYALKGARAMDSIQGGHTGHFFNMMWSPIAASQSAPAKDYRGAMDQLGWYFTLSRSWRGGLYCQPNLGGRGSKYSAGEGGFNMTTGGFGLVLAVSRRHLRILGAPKSVFAQELPAELDAARKLHVSNNWDEAIQAVDAFLKKGGHSKETLRLANELRDKSRYVLRGMQEAYAKLEELAGGAGRGPQMGSRPVKVMGIISHLRMLAGDDDAKLKQIEAALPETFRGIWNRGVSYNQAYRTLRELNSRVWFIYASLLKELVPDLAMPADSPAWRPIANLDPDRHDYCFTMIKGDVPKDWTTLDFDDSQWKKPEAPVENTDRRKKKAKPESGHYLVRVPFELKSPNVTQLRLRDVLKAAKLPAGGKVYLNGACIFETVTGLGHKQKVTLLDSARNLLRKGRNVLAISSPGNMPYLIMDADGIWSQPFEWTPVPGRDAEILAQVGTRRIPETYHNAEKDTRTADELMASFEAAPYFMPEGYYALNRFQKIVSEPNDKTPYVNRLLNSKVWGARWAGLCIICDSLTPLDKTELQKVSENNTEAQAFQNKRMAANTAWSKQFVPQIVSLTTDPHHAVRSQAAKAAGIFGEDAKDAIPSLTKLVADVEGQNWFVRAAALKTLTQMPLEETEKQAIVRVALSDPNSNVRANVLNKTFRSSDSNVKTQAVQTYKKELIDQIFDAPHGMFTRTTRSGMAKLALETLSNDEIRPHLPRFFESLSRPVGGQLDGSIAVLVSFGDEVVPKLKELANSDDLLLRFNAVDTLRQIAAKETLTPEMAEFLKKQIQPLLTMEGKIKNVPRSSTAQKWLETLETAAGTPTIRGGN